MTVSVILATYNQPAQLELVLWGYAAQRRADFELVIADDGSRTDTAEMLARMARDIQRPIVHVWHEDRGFRKTEILNRAICASAGEYLVFSDGDCIPRDDFVAAHVAHAEPDRFLSGGYLKLDAGTSGRITACDVRSGRVADPAWLRARGWRAGTRALRLTRNAGLARLLDRVTPTRPTWNGHNASAWRADLVSANGYDLEMAYGGLDRALGEVLENAGVRGKQIRHQAPVLHLHHARPYADRQRWDRNAERRRRIREERWTRAPRGIAELDADPTLQIRRFSPATAEVPTWTV